MNASAATTARGRQLNDSWSMAWPALVRTGQESTASPIENNHRPGEHHHRDSPSSQVAVPQRRLLAEWNPGLDDASTLGAAYGEMPGDDAAAIPRYVKLLENPASPIALPGAVDLFGHDCIHILLGRGTLSQDEAFVIGVTMGASGDLAAWQHRLYALSARFMYRGAYRFSRSDLAVFDAAVEYARHSPIRPLHDVLWRDLLDQPLGEVRTSLGIDTDRLITAYDAERALWPGSRAAQRLPRRCATTVASQPQP